MLRSGGQSSCKRDGRGGQGRCESRPVEDVPGKLLVHPPDVFDEPGDKQRINLLRDDCRTVLPRQCLAHGVDLTSEKLVLLHVLVSPGEGMYSHDVLFSIEVLDDVLLQELESRHERFFGLATSERVEQGVDASEVLPMLIVDQLNAQEQVVGPREEVHTYGLPGQGESAKHISADKSDGPSAMVPVAMVSPNT